ncbi:MAG: exodeoxyribonuclease VII large subunit [Arachnia sp.]
MSLASSPEQPQPLGRVVMAVKDWVGRLGEIWVDAQVIEIKRRRGATQFLTIRDRIADISASVTVSALVLDEAGPLPEGSRVTARLKPRVWDRNASLSFECLELRASGEGKLLAQLERLKHKLHAEGLFDAARKRPLPFLPRRIGLITARDSDAERDVMTQVARRWPREFAVAHVAVQGPSSAESVMTALARLDAEPEVEVIILARGGGSLEDLLSFSDEGVVRAVAACRTPVMSAIGHEQDYPLVDLAADVRASTPTDAGRRVVPELVEQDAIVATARQRLRASVGAAIEQRQRALDDLRSRPVLRDPTSAFRGHEDRLRLLRHQLDAAIDSRLREQERWLAGTLAAVRAMSPDATLRRGYAILATEDDQTLTSVSEARAGQRLTAHLSDGTLRLDVQATQENDG